MTATEPAAKPKRLAPEIRRALARVKDGTASETDLQRVVIQYAKDHGWLVHHGRKAQVKEGRWVTPVWGHPGYVDLTLVRNGRFVVAELKAKGGSVSDEQQIWHGRLEQVTGIEFYLWRPVHWPAIRRALR